MISSFRRRINAGPLENCLDVRHEVGVLQLAPGQVDAYNQAGGAGGLLAPLLHLAASLLQHPAPDRQDQTGFFR